MAASDILRDELLALIDGQGAHMPFDAAVEDFPDDAINRRPPNVSYTAWHLLEHIRAAQWDIVDYIRNRAYLAPNWPEEYWPAHDAIATPEQFARTLEAYRADRTALRELVAAPDTNLLATIRGTPGTRSSERCGWSAPTTPTTSASSRSCARSWELAGGPGGVGVAA
jgi:alkylation response protein AidB-like acyl-CoA dehydrogenase